MGYIAAGLVANLDLVGYMNDYFYSQVQVVGEKKPERVINTWDEFCQAICWTRNNGSGAEYIVTDVTILNRLENMLQWKTGIGGTGLQASYAAGYAGYNSIVNIPIMSDELKHIVAGNKPLTLAFEKEGDIPKHYIVEYSNMGRSNRIIFRKLNEFQPDVITSSFIQQIKNVKCEWLLISGYHAFDNSEDIDRALRNTIEFLELIQDNKPKIHLELASIWSLKEQWKIVESLRPYVDSVGLNEDEFTELMNLQKELLSLNDQNLIEEVEKGYSLINISHLILHTKQFSLVMSQESDVTCWDAALRNGNKLAFSRAMKGNFCNQEEIEQLTSNTKRSDRGIKLRALSKHRKDFLVSPGFVGETVSTIGLGDTFTAGLLAVAPSSSIAEYSKKI